MKYFVRVYKTTMLDAEIMQIKSNNRQCKYTSALIVYFMFWIVKLGWGNKTGGQSYISCYSRRLTGLQTRRIWGEECTESFIEAGWCCLCLPINCHYTVGSGQRGGHGFRLGLIGRMLGISGVRCTAHRHYLRSALLRTKYLCVEWQQMTNTNKF